MGLGGREWGRKGERIVGNKRLRKRKGEERKKKRGRENERKEEGREEGKRRGGEGQKERERTGEVDILTATPLVPV